MLSGTVKRVVVQVDRLRADEAGAADWIETGAGADAEHWVGRVRSIQRHKFKDSSKRAPYKPLLLLWLIGRVAQGLPGRVSFEEAEADLRRLMKKYQVGGTRARVEIPFVYLSSAPELWTVQDSSGSEVIRMSQARRESAPFLRKKAVGALGPAFEEALRDERVRSQVVNALLQMEFPDSQHEEVLHEVNLGHLVTSEHSPSDPEFTLDPEFERTVLRAYENRCSFCDYDVLLGGSPVGLDAVHVQMRAKGGPDSIENGLALCVQHHHLFDWGALGLDHDHQILVSEHLILSDGDSSTRIRELVGTKIRSPLRRYSLPALEHIDWHYENLFKHPARAGTSTGIAARVRERHTTHGRPLEPRLTAPVPPSAATSLQATPAPVSSPQLTAAALHSIATSATSIDKACTPTAEIVDILKKASEKLADDVGLIDEKDLHSYLPYGVSEIEWQALIERAGLYRIHDCLALRDNKRSRTKAALLSIGQPATTQEVAKRGGLNSSTVGVYLSSIESIVRADKKRWGIKEWVDDEYEGIPAEIIQRIEEDGGSTRLNRLLEELPRLFGVSPNSVQQSCVSTPALRLEHGWVSMVDESEIIVGRFENVATGHDDNGDPYWTFLMHDKYMRGVSVRSVPPELAVALGCQFGTSSVATVRSPQGGHLISIKWSRISSTGPEIKNLRNSLQALGATEGTLIRLVLHTDGQVSFMVDDPVTSKSRASDQYERGYPLASSESSYQKDICDPQPGVKIATPISGRFKSSHHSYSTEQNASGQ